MWGEREPAHRGQEAERNGPDALVPYLRKLKPKQEVQGFEDDGEAAAEHDGADQPKSGGEPKPVVEQPEGGVALSPPDLSRQADGKHQEAK